MDGGGNGECRSPWERESVSSAASSELSNVVNSESLHDERHREKQRGSEARDHICIGDCEYVSVVSQLIQSQVLYKLMGVQEVWSGSFRCVRRDGQFPVIPCSSLHILIRVIAMMFRSFNIIVII